MFTLDGRMRFQLALKPEDERAFHERKLFEITLKRSGEGFLINFRFGDATGAENVVLTAISAPLKPQPKGSASAAIPEYVLVEEAA